VDGALPDALFEARQVSKCCSKNVYSTFKIGGFLDCHLRISWFQDLLFVPIHGNDAPPKLHSFFSALFLTGDLKNYSKNNEPCFYSKLFDNNPGL
jgi:hypothetical protein